MASGVITGTTNSGYITARVLWYSTPDTPTNTSDVYAILQVRKSSSSSSPTWGTMHGNIRIDGQLYSYEKYMEIPNNNVWQTVFTTGIKTIAHDSDGAKSITIDVVNNNPDSGYVGMPGTSYTDTYLSGTAVLDTIPRKSIITSIGADPLTDVADAEITVDTTNYYAGFNLDFKLVANGVTVIDYGDVGSWTNITPTVGSQEHILPLTVAQMQTIMALSPNSTTVTMYLYCRTQSGTTTIGEDNLLIYGAMSSVIKPTFSSFTITDENTEVNSVLGVSATRTTNFVKLLSQLELAINGASGIYGSTITAYQITYNDINYSASNLHTGNINWSGDMTVKAKVTDSRTRSYEVSIIISALNYAYPTITDFAVSRNATTETQADSNVDVSATSLNVGGEKNTLQFKLYAREVGGSYGTPYFSSTPSSTLSIEVINSHNLPFDITKSYEFKLEAIDEFVTTIAYGDISTAKVLMSFDAVGVGINKIRENGVLDVNGDSYFEGAVNVRDGLFVDNYAQFDSKKKMYVDIPNRSSETLLRIATITTDSGTYTGCGVTGIIHKQKDTNHSGVFDEHRFTIEILRDSVLAFHSTTDALRLVQVSTYVFEIQFLQPANSKHFIEMLNGNGISVYPVINNDTSPSSGTTITESSDDFMTTYFQYVDMESLYSNKVLSKAGLLAIAMEDSFLRLNSTGAFTSGVYFGSSLVRTDGAFQVGIGGAYVEIAGSQLSVNVNQRNTKYLEVDYDTGKAYDDLNTTPSDVNRWNNRDNCALFLENSNQGMAFWIGGVSNDRKGGIQLGHESPTYPNALGELQINGLGGTVVIGKNNYGDGVIYLRPHTTSTRYAIFNDDGSGSNGTEPTLRPTSDAYGYIGTSSYRWYRMYRTAAYSTSDEKLKKNIAKFNTNAILHDLDLIDIYTYTYDKENGDAYHLGLLVQELPSLLVDNDMYGEGSSIEDLSISVFALGAVKELKNIIADQEKRILILEGKINGVVN